MFLRSHQSAGKRGNCAFQNHSWGYLVAISAVLLHLVNAAPDHTQRVISSPHGLKRVSHIVASPAYDSIFVADEGNHCVRRYAWTGDESAGRRVSTEGVVVAGECGVPSVDAPRLQGPTAIAVDQIHELLWVVDQSQHLHSFSLTEEHDAGQLVAEYDMRFERVPSSIAVLRGKGHLFFSFPETQDSLGKRKHGDIVISLMRQNSISSFDAQNENDVTNIWGPCSKCDLTPAISDDGFPYFYYNCTRLHFSILQGNSLGIRSPEAITVDPVSGTLYFVDSMTNRVYSYDLHMNLPADINGERDLNRVGELIKMGTLSVVAGTGQRHSVDGHVMKASFNTPIAISFNPRSNSLLVAESGGHLRKVIVGRSVETVLAGDSVMLAADILTTHGLLYYCNNQQEIVQISWSKAETERPRQHGLITMYLMFAVGSIFAIYFAATVLHRRWKSRSLRYQRVIPKQYLTETIF